MKTNEKKYMTDHIFDIKYIEKNVYSPASSKQLDRGGKWEHAQLGLIRLIKVEVTYCQGLMCEPSGTLLLTQTGIS